MQPLDLGPHVGEHLLIDLEAAFQLDALLDRVDDLQEALAQLEEGVGQRLLLGQVGPLEAELSQFFEAALEEEASDGAVALGVDLVELLPPVLLDEGALKVVPNETRIAPGLGVLDALRDDEDGRADHLDLLGCTRPRAELLDLLDGFLLQNFDSFFVDRVSLLVGHLEIVLPDLDLPLEIRDLPTK